MKLYVLLAVVAVAAAQSKVKPEAGPRHVRDEFEAFKAKFNKVYESPAEEARRFHLFAKSLREVEQHNKAGHSWTKGINRFSDMTHSEFQSTLGYINLPKPDAHFAAPAPMKESYSFKAWPAAKDWMSEGAVSPVKDQGNCGSCWAFASTEMIESYSYLTNGTMEILSPQQITSCTPNELQCGGGGGCTGSIPQMAFTYAQLFGVTLDSNYPYVSGDTGNTEACNYDASNPTAIIRGWELLPRNNYEAVMDHLANEGPLAIAIDAGPWGAYEGGVFDGCAYDSNIGINHAVQLVGYGTDADTGRDYWLVRNSWGTGWGEDGFIRLAREAETQCGEDQTPLYGTGCVGDYFDTTGNPQPVCGQCGILFDVTYPIGAKLI